MSVWGAQAISCACVTPFTFITVSMVTKLATLLDQRVTVEYFYQNDKTSTTDINGNVKQLTAIARFKIMPGNTRPQWESPRRNDVRLFYGECMASARLIFLGEDPSLLLPLE